ncbi:hypothetical protein [Cellulomonas aerilata]|uniref:Uncharacterized protein n=1 Tax=Cellulomonas aerilata TaxID=515326 RepID=A0A512D8R3_9CELL|nr:hypothetical protein [Cellulomonas aerilata]GEO32859.1 hypothetical protein CAE01nite_05840 [Cellulomonas aerilata]
MATSLGLVLLALLVAATVAIGLLTVLLAAARGPAPLPSQAARAAVRHGGTVHAIALASLLAAVVLVPPAIARLVAGPAQGVALGLAPATAGLAFAAVQAAGEVTWPRPSGTLRRAPLTRRTVRDVAPRRLRAAAWGWAALALVTLVACGWASQDGRAISRTFADGAASSGPFPGWYFGVPLVAAVLVVLLAAEGVLRLVARRPSVADADPAWDMALRRLSAHRVLRGTQLVLAWTAAGVLLVAGAALRSVGHAVVPGVASESALHTGLGSGALTLGLAVALTGTVLALVPATPVAAPTGLATAGLDAPA